MATKKVKKEAEVKAPKATETPISTNNTGSTCSTSSD
jgi:hypothetical protein